MSCCPETSGRFSISLLFDLQLFTKLDPETSSGWPTN